MADLDRSRRRSTAGCVVALLLGSMAAIATAPLLMPASYSMVTHSVSESAAQGVDGAWLARSGFLLLGFGVLTLSSIAGDRWGLAGRVIFRIYAVGIIATAAFSHMPWAAMPYDRFEDTLHSWASGVVGFSFIVGVVSVGFQRGTRLGSAHVFDAIAVMAAIGISYFIFATPDVAGAIQRIMFTIAFGWFITEAVRTGWNRDGPESKPAVPATPSATSG